MMEGGDLEAGSNQVDHDYDEGSDKDEFKDFPRRLAVEEESYVPEYVHKFFPFLKKSYSKEDANVKHPGCLKNPGMPNLTVFSGGKIFCCPLTGSTYY